MSTRSGDRTTPPISSANLEYHIFPKLCSSTLLKRQKAENSRLFREELIGENGGLISANQETRVSEEGNESAAVSGVVIAEEPLEVCGASDEYAVMRRKRRKAKQSRLYRAKNLASLVEGRSLQGLSRDLKKSLS